MGDYQTQENLRVSISKISEKSKLESSSSVSNGQNAD
jgi:hypothetical protein